jgi:hypothetical protein
MLEKNIKNEAYNKDKKEDMDEKGIKELDRAPMIEKKVCD